MRALFVLFCVLATCGVQPFLARAQRAAGWLPKKPFRLPGWVAALLASLVLTSQPLSAQEHPTRLKVGIYTLPPLAMKDPNGHWGGVAVDLWERVSQHLGVSFEYVETPFDQILTKLNQGDLDLAVGEFGVSAERERLVDFSQPFFATSVAVALPKSTAFAEWREILGILSSHGLVPVIAIMMGMLVIFSVLFWIIERHVQKSHFGGRPIHGFGSALWFAAVTMTTVGYGDKTPQTPFGRFLAFVWMFLGILLVSAFTGSVASSFTVARLNSTINRVTDLSSFRCGVLNGSLAQNLLSGAGVSFKTFSSIDAGLEALQRHTITAFAGDEVTLRYAVRSQFGDSLRVAAFPHTHITYAMATRPNYPELEALNVAILDITDSIDWQQRVEQLAGSTLTAN